MAQHASAEKRNRQNIVKRARNTAIRSRMRTAIKAAREAIDSKGKDRDAVVKDAVANIARAATKHVITKGTADRHVSRLMKANAKAARA